MIDGIEQLEAQPQPRHPRRLLRPRVRVLGLMLPPAAVAWTAAVAAHLAVIGGAVLVIRLSSQMHWVGGGGTYGGLVQNPDGAGDAISSRLPGASATGGVAPQVVWAQPVPLHASDSRSDSAADDSAVQWSKPHTAGTLDFSSDDNTTIRLGSAQGSPTDPVPTFRSHARPDTGKPGGPSGQDAGGGGGATSFTGPGLPGALHGTGLPRPEYPEESRRRREQGTVRVSLEVLEDGSLGAITLVTDPGFPSLGKSALTAANRLRSLRFEPAREGGRPVRSVLVVPYVFQLK